MFSNVERRLLWNNLAVLGGILLVFTLAVYTLFAQSTATQLDERLVSLARAVSLSVEREDGESKFDESIYLGSGKERVVLGETAVAQWLDLDSRVVRARGRLLLKAEPLHLDLPFSQDTPQRARVFSQSVRDPETGKLFGYVRVALALAPLENTLNQLRWGLAGGVILALSLAALGSFWLTRQAMTPVEAGYQRLQQFTADASHELRSPLTAIKLNTGAFLRHPQQLSLDEIQDSFLQIQDAADQMSQLTNDLLWLARADEGSDQQTNQAPLSLDKLLLALIQEMDRLAQKKQIDLRYRNEASPTVFADVHQLNRLFRNLIENAIQYTAPKGQVTVLLQKQEPMALVYVSDTGIGIAPENMERVFDRFWRADKARSRHGGGAGLGLAIAKSIARVHGGNIQVTSRENEGSSFLVKLPLWKVKTDRAGLKE
jgi:two-component system, OmpR family, manganese sensing sensor histidine kinase